MALFKFSTGRNYGIEQVISVTAVEDMDGDPGFNDCLYSFTDESRNISGKVLVFGFERDTRSSVKEAIMREYDAGRYFL